MNKKQLQEIADIVVGHTMRSALNRNIGKDMFILRGTDIPGELQFSDVENFKKATIEKPQPSAIISDGDILITARSTQGANINASVCRCNINKIILATSSLFILRIKDASFLPEYIALYLNSSEGQKALKRMTTQGTIQSISIKQLKTLGISVVDLEKQKTLIDFGLSVLKQKQLLKRKTEVQSIIVKNIINLV